MKQWWKSKAIWVAVAAIATALGAYFGGEMTMVELIQTAFGAIIAIFIRTGIGTPIGKSNGQ